MSFLLGFCGALAVLALLAIGMVAGWKLCRWDTKRQVRSAEEHMDEAELHRLIAEQKAFDAMQTYTAEQAYGLRYDDGGDGR